MTTTRTKAEQVAYGTEMSVQIVAVWCPSCGVPYGLAKSYRDRRRDDHQGWKCPNGCAVHFPAGTSDLEKKAAKLEAELEAARSLAQREANRRVQAEHQVVVSDRRRAAAKGQLTKTKNRIANGVCPCCNRTFVNLGKHMAGQHPDYTEARP